MMSFYYVIGLIAVPAAFFGLWYVVGYNPGAQKHWEILPTLPEYKLRHPQCLQDGKITCYHCGSSMHLDLGLLSYTDWRRQIQCKQCKNRLWREQE